MVPGAGIEPARLAAGDFESPASTNFTTRARGSRARPGDGCGRCEDRDYMRSLASCQARAGRPCRSGGWPGQHASDSHPIDPYFFSGKNQFITSAQIPPVATPDSSTLFTECGRCDRISGTCDTPNPSAKDTAMMSSARRSS